MDTKPFSPASRILRTHAILIMIILPQFTSGQVKIDNGKYFYHKENIASNFFDKPKFVIDSVIFFYEQSGDTLTYWTVGTSTPYEARPFKKIEKSKDFGKYLQKGLTLTDGRITVHRLSSKKFLIRNDSLFQWSETYRIAEDSIKILTSKYESTTTVKQREELNDLMEKNEDHDFVFIFSPKLFNDGIKEHTIQDKRTQCANTVTLINYWLVGSMGYYHFEISNNCGFWGHRWGFIISENFTFVTFGGYSSKEAKWLTRETLKTNELLKQ